jgi:hypothetical protein
VGSSGKRGGVRLLRLGQLLIQGLGRIKFERQGRLANGNRSGLLVHLLAFEVSLKRIQEQPVMRHAIPVENLLLLLGTDAVVLVQEVQERTLGLLQGRIGPGLEISQVRENALLKFLGVLDRAAKGLESEGEASHDIGSGNVEEVAPRTASLLVVDLARYRRRFALTRERKTHSRRSAGGSDESAGRAASQREPRGGSISLSSGQHDRPCMVNLRVQQHTIIDLLQGDLRIVREALLGFS